MNSLKRQNRLALGIVLGLNFAAFAIIARGGTLLEALRDRPVERLADVIPAALAALLAGVLNSQLPSDVKARLVFMKWTNPLPGSRAFSRYAHLDPRIDPAALARLTGPFPISPGDQNSLWYRLYRSVQADAAVRDAHQSYLLFRDYASLSLLLGVVLIPSGAWYAVSTSSIAGFALLLLVQLLLAARAARIHGERLVCTVLAIKSAEEFPNA